MGDSVSDLFSPGLSVGDRDLDVVTFGIMVEESDAPIAVGDREAEGGAATMTDVEDDIGIGVCFI